MIDKNKKKDRKLKDNHERYWHYTQLLKIESSDI